MRSFYSTIFLFVISNSCNYSSGLNATQNLVENSGTIVNDHGEGVSETQYATCRIATEELVANAQATVTRVLTGVCNSETVDARFQNLERLIKREFDEVKQKLNSLAEGTKSNFQSILDPRQEEIDRLNNTVNTVNTVSGVEKTFSYFMRVKDFRKKTSRWDSGWYERSPTFYLPLKSYAMYLNVIPREVHGEITYVSIGAGLTRGIYDETLEWPFYLKHQVEILDHSAQGFRRDLRSSIMDPLASGSPDNWAKPINVGNGENHKQTVLTIPANFLTTDISQSQSNFNQNVPKYIWNGDLIVKLIVYLP